MAIWPIPGRCIHRNIQDMQVRARAAAKRAEPVPRQVKGLAQEQEAVNTGTQLGKPDEEQTQPQEENQNG